MDISKHPIPKSLKKCTIENSVIKFHFLSPYHRLHIQDQVVNAFKESGVELQEFRAINEIKTNPNAPDPKISFFSDGIIKFLIGRQTISFNCVSSYPGWDKFFKFIKFAVNAIPSQDLSFNEVSIRYISTYNLPIFEKLDGNVKLNWFNDINGAEVRFPAKGNVFSGLVRVTNLLASSDGNNKTSYVDVDLRTTLQNGTKEDAFNSCEILHLEEKKHYFQLLSYEFVKELEPTYE